MTTAYSITKDDNANPSTGSFTCLIPSDTAYQVILTANTVASITVPAANNAARLMAKFSYAIATGNPVVWAQVYTGTNVVLPTTTATATPAELNPAAWQVKVGQEIQLITGQTGVNVSITYYALPNNTQ